jgi:hypothetical protein
MEGIPLFQWEEFFYFNGKKPSISMVRNNINYNHHHDNEDNRKSTKHPSISMERIPLFKNTEHPSIIIIILVIIIIMIIERTLTIPLFQWKESVYFNGKNPSI